MRTFGYTEEDYKLKCKQLDLIYLGSHKEKKKGTVIDFICPKHKDKGVQSKDWSHFKDSSFGCSYCAGRNKTNKDIEDLIDTDKIELISTYLGNEKPITCRCKICGNEWETLPKVLVTNKSGCPKCGRIKASNSRRRSQKDVEKELYEVNRNIKMIGRYMGVHTPVLCKCLICGNQWNGYPANLLNKSAGCPRCNISIGERKMLDILDKLEISYIPQYQINDGTRIRPLRFDAYNEEFKIAFEFNGEQHYRPVDFACNGEEWANQQFKKGQERDGFKNKYCQEHGITMIIIPYWEKENMEDFIVTKLKELKLELVS